MAKQNLSKKQGSYGNQQGVPNGLKAFISWSGENSKLVANALKNWLPEVVDGIQPWLSSQDIKAGMRWNSEIDRNLQEINFGIVCLTRDNLQSPWILFEAGALSKSVDVACVVPYRFNVSTTDINPPLGQFQSVNADREGTLRLVRRLNDESSTKLDDSRLIKRFEKWWPDLDKELSGIPTTKAFVRPRTDRELLMEILEHTRRSNVPDEMLALYREEHVLMMSILHDPEFASFNTGFDLIDYIDYMPIHVAEKMGDGTLYAYWRSIKEFLASAEDSGDDAVLRDCELFNSIEEEVLDELKRRLLNRLNSRSKK